MTSLKIFKAEEAYTSLLSENEKKVLSILIKAVKYVDGIFLLQEHHINNGGNLYPRDATKTEIEEAALKNPKILSPFTVVERDENGTLVTVDYHIKYSEQLGKAVKLIKEASTVCENNNLKKYLDTLAQAILNGDYEQIDKEWLLVKNSNLDMVFGPYERYIDKLFFMKRAFQGSVGIIDRDKTEEAEFIRDILYTTVGVKPGRINPPSIVKLRVECPLIFSGLLGRMLLSQQHLPSDTETVEKYGSRIIIYTSVINYKFEKLIYPIFNSLFEKTFKKRYTKELLKKGNYYGILLQGIAQHLHRYKGSRHRLRDLFPIYDEANSAVSGIHHAKYLVLKGVIDQKELEAIMVTYICWIFSEWLINKKSSIREGYLKGDALNLNFLLREGAIQEKDGLSWPNFAKMFFEIENLASIFTNILENGSYMEAQEFLSKYLSYDSFKVFDKTLANIEIS